jgi:haloacetate dehalogenase
MANLLEGFIASTFTYQHPSDGQITIAYQTAGHGPPLLLLHGFPQSKIIWHLVATQLSKYFTVIASDLRGYGQSSKPTGSANHANYSKRSMANDQLVLMRHLGFDSFHVLGHDRGGRVAHRLAADHPDCVQKIMVLDISPTLAMYEQTSMQFARGYWHWFFLIQKSPIPETLIGADVEFFLKQFMGGRYAGLAIFKDFCWQEYVGAMQDPACIHAMCEDYRAASTIDLDHDRIDITAGKQLHMPLRVLWGEHGLVNACFSPLADWSKVATQVSGKTVNSGHYIPEEASQELLADALAFFK